MFLVSNWSFQNGFLDYVNRSELSKLEGLSIALQESYAKHGSFSHLEKQPRAWRKLIRDNINHPPRPKESTLMRAPQSDDNSPKKRPVDFIPKKNLLLLDHKKNILIGPQREPIDLLFLELKIEDEIVGYVGLAKRQQLSQRLDKIFADQQKKSYLWIALGSLLISLIIALPFSKQLIKPILELLNATKQLSIGNYSSRVSIQSKDEIGKLSSSFNQMADDIEAHQKTQKQWLADISHELRTPLSVLKGEIEAILDGIRTADQQSIESLFQEVNYINRLVEDLHELAKSDMEAMRLDKQEFSLLESLQDSLKIFEREINNKNLAVTISCKDNFTIYGDQSRINQVFINLFQNNIRYTQESGVVHITIKKDSDNCLVSWEDNGPGVKQKNIGKLFDRLYREDDSRSNSNRGSGLGLSICKTIIENHHGELSAFHSSLGGLGLTIKLPLTI